MSLIAERPISISVRDDIFSREAREWAAVADGQRLLDILPPGSVNPNVLVTINGKPMKGKYVARYVPQPGDRVELDRIPFGPAIGIPAIVGVGVSFVAAGVQALFTPVVDAGPAPLLLQDEEGNNPSRGWLGFQTTRGPGRPIPIVFGEVRCSGQVIESFYEPQFLKWEVPSTATQVAQVFFSSAGQTRLSSRIGYCVGPIEEIHTHEVDGNLIANYAGVSYETLLGDTKARAPDGFNETKTVQDVSTTVTYSGGAITKTTTTYCTSVEIRLVFTSGLFEIDSLKLRAPKSVDVKFEYKKTADAGWTTYTTLTIEDINPGAFPVWVRLPRLDYAIYDVRVTRMTVDNVDPDDQDEFDWDLMQEVFAGSRAHPGIAQVAYRQFPTEQNPVPRNYTAVVKGINTMRIYSSPGSYTVGWSNNPAWCLAWFITDAKHGLGQFFTWDHIDLESFCRFADDCDELVDNGREGKEKRATFDYELNTSTRAQDALRKFTEGTRAFPPQYLGGKWRIVLDLQDEPRQLFHEGNIAPGTLTYRWTETMTRPTRVLVNFPNVESDYELDTFLQEDPELTDEYPVDSAIVISGAVRPSQIARQCMRLLDQRRLRDRTVEFATGVEAYRLIPGALIDVATVSAGLGIASGRILEVSADKSELKIDDDLTLDIAKSYEVTVYHQLDGSTTRKALTGVTADPTQHVTVSNTIWRVEPKPGDGYSVGEAEYATERFRVMEISEDSDFKRRISAHLFVELTERIISNPDIFNYRIGNPRMMPAAVESVTAYWLDPEDSAGDTVSNIDGAWDPGTIRQYIGRSIHEFQHSRYDVYVRASGSSQWRFAESYGSWDHAAVVAAKKMLSKDLTLEYLVVIVTKDGIRLPLDQATYATVATP